MLMRGSTLIRVSEIKIIEGDLKLSKEVHLTHQNGF